MTNPIKEMITNHPVFIGFPDDYIQTILDQSKKRDFGKSSTVFVEGEEANHFYLLLSGMVDLSIHTHSGPVSIQTLRTGDVLGWSWLFPPYLWHYDAIAKKDTEVLQFDGGYFRQLIKEDSLFGIKLISRFSNILLNRLNATRLQLVDMYGKSN